MSDSRDPIEGSLPGSSVHGLSRQEYWSGLPFPSPGDLPEAGIELESLVDSLPLPHLGSTLLILKYGFMS